MGMGMSVTAQTPSKQLASQLRGFAVVCLCVCLFVYVCVSVCSCVCLLVCLSVFWGLVILHVLVRVQLSFQQRTFQQSTTS